MYLFLFGRYDRLECAESLFGHNSICSQTADLKNPCNYEKYGKQIGWCWDVKREKNSCKNSYNTRLKNEIGLLSPSVRREVQGLSELLLCLFCDIIIFKDYWIKYTGQYCGLK